MILISSQVIGQDTSAIKNVLNNSGKIEVLSHQDLLPESDTLNLHLDKDDLEIPVDIGEIIKVILIKEKSGFDFLKYLLPIFTLILGILIKEVMDRRSEKKRIKKSGERWIAELQSLHNPIKKQIESLKSFLKELEKEDFQPHKFQVYTSLSGEVFKSLDKNDLIKFIELRNKKSPFGDVVKISNNVHGNISILVHLHETIQNKFERYQDVTSKYTTFLTKSLQAFHRAFRKYGVEIEKEIGASPIEDPQYKLIADLYLTEIYPNLEDGNFNPFVLEKEFYRPLVDILADLRSDERTDDLYFAVHSALNDIKGIKMERGYMMKITKKILQRYNEQLSALKIIIADIQEIQLD